MQYIIINPTSLQHALDEENIEARYLFFHNINLSRKL